MLDKFLVFQFGGFSGGSIGELFAFLEQNGFFSYILPFLLIFALVFAIMMRTQIFKENRSINAVIALTVALLALQFDFVPVFFSEIFPRVGVALSVILALMILAGLFFDPENKVVGWGLLIVGVITFLIVLFQTTGRLGITNAFWWNINWAAVIAVALFIGAIIAVINGGKEPKGVPEYKPLLFQQSKN